MRISRPLLVALCLALVGAMSLQAPASAQRTPREPQTPGGDFPTPEPTPPAQPAQPIQRPPATATPPAATVTPSPTVAPTPTQAPTRQPTVVPSPTRTAEQGSGRVGLAVILGIAALVLVGLLIFLARRLRTDKPDEPPPPPLVVGPGPAIEPTPESAATEAAVTEAATASGNTIVCENCGRSSPAEFQFCDACGARLQKPPS